MFLLALLPVCMMADESEARTLSLREAVLEALGGNGDLKVHRLERDAIAAGIDVARAVFDPQLNAQLSRAGADTLAAGRTTTDTYQAGIAEHLPTGTDLSVTAIATRHDPGLPDVWSTRAEMGITQALLQGRSLDTNLASLRRARYDVDISDQELRGYTTALVAEAEGAYWDLVLADRRLVIVTKAEAVARQQVESTAARIRAGRSATSEQVASDAELAARRQDHLDADAACEQARLKLIRLLALDWSVKLALITVAEGGMDACLPVEEHLQVADRLRSDLLQARLQRQRGELDVIETRNGLLPRLDFFAVLGSTGYAGAMMGSELASGRDRDNDVTVGLRFAYAIGNRAAAAAAVRAGVDTRRLDEAMANQARQVAFDVRSAHAESRRAAAGVEVRRATALLRAETRRTVQARVAVGRGTTLELAQAERDVLVAELDVAQAEVQARVALTDLYRLDGSLLQRRGIVAPGLALEREPGR